MDYAVPFNLHDTWAEPLCRTHENCKGCPMVKVGVRGLTLRELCMFMNNPAYQINFLRIRGAK